MAAASTATRLYCLQDVAVVRTVDDELPSRAFFHPHNAVIDERVGARQYRRGLNQCGAAGRDLRGLHTRSKISPKRARCRRARCQRDDLMTTRTATGRLPCETLATTRPCNARTTFMDGVRQTQAFRRGRAIVLVLDLDTMQADVEADHWRALEAVVIKTRDAGGCLRMATSIGPDVIVLDQRVPDRLVRLLRAHPVSSSARLTWLAPPPRVSCRYAA